MRISKEKSIDRCEMIWVHIAENPELYLKHIKLRLRPGDDEKFDPWKLKEEVYKAIGLIYESDVWGCPACEYHATHKQNYCQHQDNDGEKIAAPSSCIINWGNNNYNVSMGCEYDDSPFMNWIESENTIEFKKYAKEVLACIRNSK